MESHIRIKISTNWIALQQLDCSTYKVLMSLSARADNVGVCFPSADTIASDCNLHVQTVYKALEELSSYGYTRYLRKNAYDPVIRRKLPNVYQVSPYFLEIADNCMDESLAIWNDRPYESISYINQQQNQFQELVPENQLQETTTTTKNSKSDSDEKPPTAKSEKQKTTAQPTNSAPQQKADVPPIVKKFTNPTGIAQPLPDALSEKLAERLNVWKIPMPLARGLIFKFGYDTVDRAANYTEFCSKMQEIQTMAGFFRTTLETNTHDSEMVEAMNNKRHEYDDLLDS
jgi:hypothetical protein